MRIISVNVNGIQAAVERGLLSWLQAQNADVICLQDTQCLPPLNWTIQPSNWMDTSFMLCDADVPAQGGVVLYSQVATDRLSSAVSVSETADRYGRYLQADFGQS